MARFIQAGGGAAGAGAGANITLIDNVGFADSGLTMVQLQTDNLGMRDLVAVTTTPMLSDQVGMRDAVTVTTVPALTDNVGVRDSLAVTTTTIVTDAALGVQDSAVRWVPTQVDNVGMRDSITFSATPLFSDRGGYSDSSVFNNTWIATTRSGTPDTDAWGDAWTDATVGQTTVNHGNEALLVISNVTIATENRGYMEIDFTRFLGATAFGNAHVFQWVGYNNQAAQLNQILNFGASASRPFTESTINQTNQPATPTLFTRTVGVPTNGTGLNTYTTLTVTLTDAEMQQLLGKWALIVFTASLGTLGVGVSSREDAARLPQFTFKTKV